MVNLKRSYLFMVFLPRWVLPLLVIYMLFKIGGIEIALLGILVSIWVNVTLLLARSEREQNG